MTRIIQSKYKICRRLGVSLWGSGKDPFLTKNYAPGQHGQTAVRKPSDYGIQLRAKQKLKGYYGSISEKQFRKTFKEAVRLKGDKGENLIGLLERRLDAVVYRLNFAPTIFAARQIVSHKHVRVNGKRVNIASYQVKDNDVIEINEKSKQLSVIMEPLQKIERTVPTYLELDPQKMVGKFLRTPGLSDVPYAVVMEPHLVVEFYSR